MSSSSASPMRLYVEVRSTGATSVDVLRGERWPGDFRGETLAEELEEDGVFSPGAGGRGRFDISGDFGRIDLSVVCRCEDNAWENLVGVVGRLVTTTVGAEVDARGAALVEEEPLLSLLPAAFRGRGFGTTAGSDIDGARGVASSLCGFSGGTGGPLAAGLVLGLGLATGGIFGFSAGTSDKMSGVEFLLFRFGRGGWEFTFSYKGPFMEEEEVEPDGGVAKLVEEVGSRGTKGGESLWADEGVGLRLLTASGVLVSRFIYDYKKRGE